MRIGWQTILNGTAANYNVVLWLGAGTLTSIADTQLTDFSICRELERNSDLKPENLMLSTEKTSDAVIKLIDFGCAQVTQSPDEQPGVVGLTAAYSSPEMLLLPPSERKRIDPPLDVSCL